MRHVELVLVVLQEGRLVAADLRTVTQHVHVLKLLLSAERQCKGVLVVQEGGGVVTAGSCGTGLLRWRRVYLRWEKSHGVTTLLRFVVVNDYLDFLLLAVLISIAKPWVEVTAVLLMECYPWLR